MTFYELNDEWPEMLTSGQELRYRTIAIGLSTLTALSPYRNAAASLFHCRRNSAQ
uniref:Transposase n=1 Tax=Ascaris lumbricoides TaxID=6252 RepID=A0A0M3IP96_ASCLU